MIRHYVSKITMWMCVLLAIEGLAGITRCSAKAQYLSPSALVADSQGKTLYIALATARQIAVFDTKAAKVTATIRTPAEPTGLALRADGAYLYVTCAAPKGRICIIETATSKIIKQIRAGYGARSPVLSPNGKMLYVCNRFDNSISKFEIRNLKSQIQNSRLGLREPFAADITPDGGLLFVGNQLPDGPANAEYVACKVSVINTRTMDLEKSIALPNGSMGLHGVAASPDGRYVYVSHILGRYTVPTTQLEKGWMNTNALSIIDVSNRKLINTVLLDDVDDGAANPWAVACTADGKYVLVTHAGTHELSVIDATALLGKLSGYDSTSAKDIPNELSFLYGIRQRIKLCGKGPRALAVVGSNVYIAEYFTDSMTLVDMGKNPRPETTALPLGPTLRMTQRRKGQMLFNDASLCFQQWQSCASCHPGGARADSLNWDLLNDGIGNPKNTKSLLLSHMTPPAMITGVRDSAETAVRAGIRHIQFAVRPEEDAVAIDKYLKSLKPIPSPYLVNGKLSASARRGQKIFDKAGCASCHEGPLFTDLQKYDVGTGDGLDKDRKFDTPTLVELWRTAPYLYDGRAASIKEVLTTYNAGDKHGTTSNLTDNQIRYLARFVLSL